MARVQQYLVTVSVSDEDERFYSVNASSDWRGDIQSSLDDLSCDVADDNFDDDGRMEVSFNVLRLPDLDVN